MLDIDKKSIDYLMQQFASPGMVEKITYRKARLEWPIETNEIMAIAEKGLLGDHYSKKGGKRQVTFIQKEHIAAVASFLGLETLDPKLLRRNIVVGGINLLALRGKQFQIGEAVFSYTGQCHPCSRMEENLGTGGYNAMRNHGGITCSVEKTGIIKVGDLLTVLSI